MIIFHGSNISFNYFYRFDFWNLFYTGDIRFLLFFVIVVSKSLVCQTVWTSKWEIVVTAFSRKWYIDWSSFSVPTHSLHFRLLIMFTKCLILEKHYVCTNQGLSGINWQTGHTLKKSSKPTGLFVLKSVYFFSPSPPPACPFVATKLRSWSPGHWMSACQGGWLMSVCLVSVQGEMPSLIHYPAACQINWQLRPPQKLGIQ